jgi:predicted Fe-Mo cluster-binding NifX family protein
MIVKIVIPVNEKSLSEGICISFGRTPFFMIYDTETKKETYLDNSAAAAQGGAGIKAAQAIVDSGADALITFRCGENAADVLNAAGVKIYKTESESILDSINLLEKGNLSILTQIHKGLHNHG